jgi:hypothetical protein
MSNYRGDKFNGAGYYDPTPYEAMRHLSLRDNRRKDSPKREPPRIYICSPYRGDVEVNTRNALKYCRFAVEQGYFPIAPHCYLPLFMDDNRPAERNLALSFGLRLLNGCKEIWVFGERVSEGMRNEINAAKKWHIPIRQFTDNLKEVYPKW